MKTILAPIDFSSVSNGVVRVAAALARGFDGRVVLLHVTLPTPTIAEYGKLSRGLRNDIKQWNDALKGSASRRLEHIEDELEGDFVRADAIELTGLPVQVIIGQAQQLAADYIVIGSHGHTAFFELVVGSTASGVLKLAPCPVIVVPTIENQTLAKKHELSTSRRKPPLARTSVPTP